jgi:hypothetical protein
MTELNQEPNAEPDPADAASALPPAADVAWPALPSRRGSGAEHEPQDDEPQGARAPIQDKAVSAVLDRLTALEQAPVSEHGELYAGMHDALLEALNEDVASHAGPARRVHAAGDGGS